MTLVQIKQSANIYIKQSAIKQSANIYIYKYIQHDTASFTYMYFIRSKQFGPATATKHKALVVSHNQTKIWSATMEETSMIQNISPSQTSKNAPVGCRNFQLNENEINSECSYKVGNLYCRSYQSTQRTTTILNLLKLHQ